MSTLEITVWDVNHGSAAYIKAPNNRHLVVDLGDDGSNNFSPLLALRASGIQQLDAVVITHPHADHIDDIFNFDSFSPRVLCRPAHLSAAEIRQGNRSVDLPLVNKYLEISQRFHLGVEPLNNILIPTNFGGAEFQVFCPRSCETTNLNNHSVVVVVSYAQSKMLIPGDNEAPAWKELLNDPSFLLAAGNVDILLAPHHGREAGFCSELFDAIGKPKLVVVSDGRFGDTSATSRYSNQATGWGVFDSTGSKKTRKCITTRNDGHITIQFGWNTEGSKQTPYIQVKTSRVNMSEIVERFLGVGS